MALFFWNPGAFHKYSVTSAHARNELLHHKDRFQSVSTANNDSSLQPVKVAAQPQHSFSNSTICRQRSLQRTDNELVQRSLVQNVAYELSQDLQDKQIEMLQRRYGGSVRSRHAANTIQRAYRQYCMSKNFQKLRNSITGGRRLLKLGRSNTVWTDRIVAGPHYAMGATVIQNLDLTNKPHLDIYYNDIQENLTDTNDWVPMKQQLSFDHRCNKCDKQQFHASLRKLEHTLKVDITDKVQLLNDNSCKEVAEENKYYRNLYPELNDATDCLQITPFEYAEDINCQEFKTFQEDKETNILVDSFQCDASLARNDIMLGSPALRVSLVSSNLSTDSLGSNKSINFSHENCATHSESSESASVASIQTDVSRDGSSPDHLKTREQKHMHEQTVKYLMNSAEIKYRSQSESGQNQAHNDSGKQPPISCQVPEGSPIQKFKNVTLSGSTGSLEKVDMKHMSNISKTSEADSENLYSSSHSSHNVSAENISIANEGITHQRRLQVSETPDLLGHALSNSAVNQRKLIYRIGLNLFNKKPEKGLSFLIEHGFINESPENVAQFLIKRKGLSKQMIGEYLGNLQNQFNMAVLCCFCEEIDLSGLQLDMALRKFQSYFRMPGEAQKIERLMEVFAEHYVDCNPDQVKNFQNQETVLLLAFAIIMLNTDLHNASIKPDRKMTLDDFIKNLRAIDDDEDVDKDLLVGIYERVKTQEFCPGVDHVTQVMKVEQTIVGNNKPTLALAHRRLVCYCRLYQVHDPNKKEKISLHQREVFLFNDLLLVTKIFTKRKTGITYSFKQSCSLCDMQVHLFETTHYQFGIQLVNNLDGKVQITFNARNDHDRQKFVEDIKEAILECNGMEQLRIEEQQLKNSNNVPLDRHYSNDDNRINNYEYMKASDPNSNRLSVPDCNGLKQLFPLSNSLTDLCGVHGMHQGSSVGSLDSGMHSESANSTEISFGCHGSQLSLIKEHVPITSATITTTYNQTATRGSQHNNEY